MPSFALLIAWIEATGNPQMPGVGALHALEHSEEWPPDCEGEPHRLECACPDCDPQETPILED